MTQEELVEFIARAEAEELAELSFPPNSLSDKDLEYLTTRSARLRKLRSLSFKEQPEITDSGIIRIAECLPQLNAIDLSWCAKIGDTAAMSLAKHLVDLTYLSLYGSQIGDAGVKAIANGLVKLTSLNLGECRGVSDAGLKAVAQRLTNLASLNLEGCQVSAITAQAIASHLVYIEYINLNNTFVRSLPLAFAELNRLQYLMLPNNPELGLPKEVLMQRSNPKAILAHYFRGQQEDKRQLNEAKIIVVGREAVGKTSIVRYLAHNQKCNFNERKTAGIAIEHIVITKWALDKSIIDGEPLLLNVWDFGGQEIMYETHRLFLSLRSLYLLVIEARREDDQSIHEWMRTIQNRAPDAPVILVINKTEPPQDLPLDEKQVRHQYPSIKGVVRTSCRTGLGIHDLQRLIARSILEYLPHVRDWLPESYFAVKEELAVTARTESVLATVTFREICLAKGIKDVTEQDGLLRTLNEIGVIVTYQEPTASEPLHNAALLDPNWLTIAIYKLLNHAEVMRANGEFDFSDLGRLLDDSDKYPKKWWPVIVALMERFGLCFPLPDHPNRYLIPEQLRPNEPQTSFDEQTSLRFRFDYDFLPRGLIPRFIVQAHALYTSNPTAWLNGVVLQVEGCVVIVRGNREKKQIHILVTGPAARRRNALAIVRNHFEAVHRLNPETNPAEKVPLPDHPDLAADYVTLVRMEEAGRKRYWPDGATHDYSVEELLNGVDHGPRRRPAPKERDPWGEWSESRVKASVAVTENARHNSPIPIHPPPPAPQALPVPPSPVAPDPSIAQIIPAPAKWWQPLIGPGATTLFGLLLIYLLVEHRQWSGTLYYGCGVGIFAAVYGISSYFRWKNQSWAKRLTFSFASAAIASALAPGIKAIVKVAGFVETDIEFGNSIWITVVFAAMSAVFGGIELYREKHQINAR